MPVGPLLEAFFLKLAERAYAENDLSDVTWSLCESVPTVGRAFVDFFGIPASDRSTLRFEREFDLGNGCRVDFACFVDGKPAFIENKIYDRNYHLHEYSDQIRGQDTWGILLIANHDVDPRILQEASLLGWRIYHWRQLVEFLRFRHFPDAATLVSAYLSFVLEVCSMVEIQSIHLDPATLYSLVSFHALVEELIGSASHPTFSYVRDKNRYDHGPGWSGAYYWLTAGSSPFKLHPFFGLLFERPGAPRLVLWLDYDGNNKAFLDAYRQHLHDGVRGAAFEQVTVDKNFVIRAPEIRLQALLSADLPGQRRELYSIFQEMNALLESSLASRVQPESPSETPSAG